ncbi:hypothetical protein [Thioflexithrix psekupsensis]|uniref:GspL cytoplasmic actin-ATPase-like domain-containing protein n=1 Tax=Thioflexithrix psekupsensis TaxID=1570016 RepID=A0A251X9E2_9GAMM|nr:hypothetical protein [Thioflexithrix psekupsensis]OUD14560.1 hypothetical protein TPSD3_09730 [Thioflexithrix psekupsensis]
MKRFLYLNDATLTIYHADQKELKELYCLNANDDTDLAIFKDYLLSDLKNALFILIDSALEEYQQVSLPHVFGKERQSSINIRLKRLFEQNAYTYTVLQGRETQGRGDDRFLFLAINNVEELLQPWLKIIELTQIPLQAIYSLPLLSQRLLNFLPAANHTLLVSQMPITASNNSGGVRQSFFVNNQLQFSRLTPLNTIEPHKYADSLLTQITRTERYLSSTRNLPSNEHLNVLILNHLPYFDYLSDALKNETIENINIELIESSEFSHYFGLNFSNPPVYLHHLMIHLLAKSTPKNHYARGTDLKYYRYQQISKAIYLGSFALLFFAIIDTGLIVQKTSLLTQEIDLTHRKISGLKSEIAKVDEAISQLDPIELFSIKPTLTIGKPLMQQRQWPNQALRRVSHVFNEPIYQEFILKQINWQIVSEQEKSVFEAEIDNEKKLSHTLFKLQLIGQVYLTFENYLDVLRKFNALQEALKKKEIGYWQLQVLEQPSRQNIGELSSFNLEILIDYPSDVK